MHYHVDTIPIWRVMEDNAGCPVCALFRKTEQVEIERSLGGSVMEPSVRIRVNQRGFCQRHHQQLFHQKNRLGYALLVDSHVKELQLNIAALVHKAQRNSGANVLFAKAANRRKTYALINGLEALTKPCALCETLETHMIRYCDTILHLWKSDKKFKAAWLASKGVCIPHGVDLLKRAKIHLPLPLYKEFSTSLLTLLADSLNQNEQDLEWFTQKFDYRNQDKPWYNSKNALERTINQLRGQCAGIREKE